MTGRLSGKIAIVTGAGGAIGAACTRLFAREGAIVAACDINDEALRRAVTDTVHADALVDIHHGVDMFAIESAKAFLDSVGMKYGRIDVLVNAAAIAIHAPIEQLTADEFRRTMVGEVDTVFYACQAAWPYLQRQGGSIINFGSVAAHMAVAGLPALAHTAGKGAVLAMTRQLAMEGRSLGIRANTISPGLIVSVNTQRALDNSPTFRDAIERKTMVGRLGRPEDIASGALYLASDEASFVTETDLAIDGGVTAW